MAPCIATRLSMSCRFYVDKDAEMSWILERDQWQTIQARMRECQMAVVPIFKPTQETASKKNECFVSMLCQAQMPQNLLITPLELYQRHGAEARPCMIVTFYHELMEAKEIILVRGDILEGTSVNKSEGLELFDDTVTCYFDDSIYRHIHHLNHSSSKFDFDIFLDSFRQRKRQCQPSG